MSNGAHRLVLGDGVELSVEVTGSGPAIVLLHGFTGDASTMQTLTARFVDSHTVIAPNLVGHGGSTGPADRYGVDAMAEHVLGAVEQLGYAAPFDLVGYSMGGRVALTIACRFPAHVASLALIGTSAGLATADERAAREGTDGELADSILAGGLDAFVDQWMANPLFATQSRLGDAFLAEARRQRMGNVPEELARSLRGAGTGTMRPLHEVLSAARMPIALVVGADDPKFRQIADELSGSLTDAHVEVVAGAGHAAHLEQPDAVAAIIVATLERSPTRTYPVSIALRGTHATGRGTTARRDSVLLGLRADGHTGWGEASPLLGWSLDDLGTAQEALAPRPRIDPSVSAWEATGPWRESLAAAPAARAAVAGAALDLDARRAGEPLWRYLAAWHPLLDVSRARTSLAVNALVSSADPEAVAAEVARHVGAGMRTVKLKVGALDAETDLRRIAAARRAGPRVVLRLDANGAWDHDTAISFLASAAHHDIALCEEPVAGVEAIAAVGRLVVIPVAVDESARDAAAFEGVAAHADSITSLVVKPQALGGPDLAITAIVAAQRAGLDVIVTSMIDSAVGLGHAAHVAAACGLAAAHGLATASLLERDVADGLAVIDGRIEMPGSSGLGIGLVSPWSDGSP